MWVGESEIIMGWMYSLAVRSRKSIHDFGWHSSYKAAAW